MRTLYFCPVVSFYLLLSFFIPRLISAAADWMSTHMVWPKCEFRMQVWNVLHATRWKYRTQKWCKKSPSAHHTIAQLCRAISSQLKHVSTIGKKLLSSYISPTRLYNMVNFGPLEAEIVSLVWGTQANFNGFRVLAALLHSQTAALNRGRNLYSAGRPSRWALAHISSSFILSLPTSL